MTSAPHPERNVEPHAVPTADELLEAVEECLRDEILPASDGRTSYLLRVSVAALAQVRRELALADELDDAHLQRLERLAVTGDLALADEIRAGDLDDRRREEIMIALRERVADQLRVVAPSRSSGSQ